MPEGSLYLRVMILQPIPLLPVIDTDLDLVRFTSESLNEIEPAALSRGGLGLFICGRLLHLGPDGKRLVTMGGTARPVRGRGAMPSADLTSATRLNLAVAITLLPL